MKKFYQKGLSIIELLLALGIIAIVVTLCLSISKHNADRAYNLYYYTAYKGMYDILAEFQQDGLAFEDWPGELRKILKIREQEDCAFTSDNSGIDVTAPNHVSYRILRTTANANRDIYVVYIDVPQLGSDSSGRHSAGMIYMPVSADENALHPEGIIYPFFDANVIQTNLLTRIDLLPCYLDDGNPNPSTPPEILSYNDAYCRRFSGSLSVSYNDDGASRNANITCPNPPPSNTVGEIRYINPKKL
ncbi:MAG: prepilin-type N-terminal cleavage/methylation domain-containing protein [bacterium]|nr:prepilin-type N-terminal cleavage/methylation domain-containing protein [bacterium]